MNEVSRFERGERYATVRDVTTYRGVDPLTGLDVLIYEFSGAPTVASGALTSDNIPAILATAAHGGTGSVVSALPQGAELVAPGERVVDDGFVLQALTALRDAHVLGLVHGDITPSRLLHARAQVYLEGYGVPWGGEGAATGEAALHTDLQALVRALLSLAGDNLSAEVTAALKGAAAKGSYPPMNAPRLHAIVRRLAGGAVKVPASGFNDLTLPVSGAPAATDSPGWSQDADRLEEPAKPEPRPRREPSTGAASPAASGRTGAAEFDDPEPITLNSDPGLIPPGASAAGAGGRAPAGARNDGSGQPPSPRDTSPGFVKALPPGATYRHGNLDEGLRPAPIRLDRQEVAATHRRSWRGPALLLLVLLVAGLASYLTLISQPQNGAGTTPGTLFPVDVRVEPGNLPPIQMIVDQSPPGSTYAPGTVMGSVPRRVTFDAVGTWVVHGRFQDDVTPSVTVSVPEVSSITLSFPTSEPEEQ